MLNYLGRIFSQNNENRNTASFYEQAMTCYKGGNYEEALKFFDKCADNDNGEIYSCKGLCYYNLGIYEQAISFFYKAFDCGETDVRWNLVEELEKISDERLLKIFLHLSDDKDLSLQMKAIEFIKKIKSSEEGLNIFEEYLNQNPGRGEIWYYQGLCYYNLASYEKAINSFYKALDCGDINVRRKLSEELGEKGDEKLLHIYLRLLNDKDFSIQLKAINSIEKTGAMSDEYVSYLVNIENPFIQIKFKSLIEKTIDTVEALINYINNKNSEGRLKALKILRLTRDKRMVELLTGLLNDEDRELKMEVIDLLSEFRDERVTETLINFLNNRDISTRNKVIDVIVKIKDKRVTERLLEMLQDKDLSVKCKVIDALGKSKDKRSVEDLIQMLSHEDINVRFNSVIALGNIGDEKSVEYLVPVINDTECDEIKKEAIIALGKIKDERAVEPLVSLLNMKNFRDDILESLGEIGNKRALDVINEELKKDGFLINSRAAKILKNKVWKPEDIKKEPDE